MNPRIYSSWKMISPRSTISQNNPSNLHPQHFYAETLHFLNLPNELFFVIGGFLNYECDINSLAQANTRLYLLLNSTLYQHNVRYSNSSALKWAAEYGHEATTRKAQERGASLNCDYSGWRPITLAAANSHDALVHLFIEQGVVPIPNPEDPQDSAIRILLVLAGSNGYESLIRL